MPVFRFLLFLCTCLLLVQCQSSDQQTTTEPSEPGDTPAAATAPFQNIGVDEFREMMDQEDIVILDVRTPGETAQGTIQGAVELDIQRSDFEEQIKQLDRSKTYLVYCQVGGRSSRACEMMADAGFERLYNLQGGYSAWSEK